MLKNHNRYLVKIHCNQCGEKFMLKGRMRKGRVETGFKRCLCDNESDFEVHNESL